MVQTITLPDGTILPALGAGTWNMGDTPARREEEIASLRYAVEQGIQVVDTAEMYGNGRSEKLVGEAIALCVNRFFWSARCCRAMLPPKGLRKAAAVRSGIWYRQAGSVPPALARQRATGRNRGGLPHPPARRADPLLGRFQL